MKSPFRSFVLLVSLLCTFAILESAALAAPVQTMTPMTGEIESISITAPGNVWSGGMMRVGGQDVILPANLLINLPNDYQTLQQLYANAPAACQLTGETGLAKIDRCNGRATGAWVTILANRTDSGNVIAGQVDIFKALETVNGTITYISYTDGYFRVNGIANDPTTGVMVRVNDPTTRHTIQKGLGCAANTSAVNCSPDVRFKVDPDNYTFCYVTGYPACIPTTANGLLDANCPDTNRPPLVGLPIPAPPVAADSRRFAPVKLGDSVKADGSFETVSGVTFLSASSVRVMVDLTTRTTNAQGNLDPTQPDYLIITEAGWDGPAYHQGRVRGRFLTNSTLHEPITLTHTELDYYSVHYDPVNNAAHEQVLYTTQGNKQQGAVIFNVPTGVFDSQIRMDFFPGFKIIGFEPCLALLGNTTKTTGVPVIPGVNLANYCTGSGTSVTDNFNLMVPVFREVMAHSTRQRVATGVALDIQGRPTQSGQYKLPVTIAYGAFEDANLGLSAFPTTFSGTPWLMDRRLSPNGCVGACEAGPQPLTPFPYEGIDPRTIAPIYGVNVLGTPTTLPTPDRMFRFMDTAGNMTGLLAWPPTNPPAFPIATIPSFSLFPPFADEDAASTRVGVPVIINVLANDISLYGTIDPTSVQIVTPPLSGPNNVQVNPVTGAITYIPTPSFTVGTDTFTYTVANNFGSRSLPGTVTVTIVVPPTAVNDTATVPAKSSIPINVIANDLAGTSIINLASVNIVGQPTCGTVVNQFDGVVVFNAPAAVPAGGVCTFSYLISDTSLPALISNVATVTVTITPPIAPPVAVNDTAFTTVGSTITIDLTSNDTSSTSTINAASLIITVPTGTIGTIVANSNGTVTYTAPPLAGVYSFAYTVKDNLVPPQTSNPATVTVNVAAGADVPPKANNDTVGAVVGSTISINVISNDTTTTSTINPASVTIVSVATGGTTTVNPDGTVTYTAPLSAGTYSFAYTVNDNFAPPATSNVATVTIVVAAQNVAPTANNDTAATVVGGTITMNVISNDTSTTSSINPTTVVVTPPTGGSATANLNGTVTYTAPATAGTYSFTYTVNDNFGAQSNAATATVTVLGAVDIPPVANNDTASTLTNGTVSINVIANDTSITSTINPATVTIVSATSGTATANLNGTVSYTAPAVAGTYSFTYTVQDNFVPPATSNIATVTVTVIAPIIPPTANNFTATMTGGAGTSKVINVLAHATPGTNPINPASVTVTTQPLNGSAIFSLATGSVTYTPNPAFSGIDDFTYTVRDNIGTVSNTATVSVTVNAPPNESLAVTLAQFIVNGSEWRVEGTTTARGDTITVYNNSTVGVSPLGTVAPDANGVWRLGVKPGPLPNGSQISVQSSLGAILEPVTLTIR